MTEVERFIAQYESGAQGCHMDAEDAQAFALILKKLLADWNRYRPQTPEEIIAELQAMEMVELPTPEEMERRFIEIFEAFFSE